MKEDYKVRYVSSNGVEIALSEGAYFASPYSLPSWEFDTVTLANKVYGLTRRFPEYELKVVIVATDDDAGKKARNDLYEVPAVDRDNLTPGKLYLNDWYISGYVKSVEIENYWQDKRIAQYLIKFVATEPLWTREHTKTFTEVSSDGLDYPHDFMFDFASSVSTNTIDNENHVPSLVRITVQGAAQNPSITIAGNEYKVNTTIDVGEYLEIDGYSKTIEVVSSDGARRNVFDKRDGLQVIGSGHYIFERIPTGDMPVIYSSGLIFSITVIEQRAEPRWS